MVDPTIVLEILPLVGSAITALVVFIKRSTITQIDISKMHDDIVEIRTVAKEMNNRLIQASQDVAVLKEKFHSRHDQIEVDD